MLSIVIEITPTRVKHKGNSLNRILDIENDAGEILDDSEEDYYVNGFRRSKRKSKHRNRDKGYSYSTSSGASDSRSSSSDSSDLERNPGNPFTIHKNKYKQNWLWNTFMDGNHMNLNPLAPKLGNLGPSGADLLFGRKWWYFNQDDYKPLG
ncbi:hypothetical protein K1T71_003495 [Dendrolimus kikuchii]|uniref:Uncharacterized protein n=1 Tax=Dendrolimus kikuchii TaxID=765133 RepID=A0ACC1DC35_9NEOP|nr:hypothetical protein K1T71_003495 [Dendrolimus kikuchii]